MNNEQLAQRIFDHGTFIVTIDYYNQKVNLYAVDEDFFEIYYDPESNEIVKINLAMGEDMNKYVNKIDIGRIQS